MPTLFPSAIDSTSPTQHRARRLHRGRLTLALFGLALLLEPAGMAAPSARVVVQEAASALGSGLSPLVGAEPLAAGAFVIVNAAGRAIHRTSQPVSGLRSIAIPGSALELYTWDEEQRSGARKSYYAYSRGGTTALGRVRETTYAVRLQDLEFDPLRDGQPQASAALAADYGDPLQLVQFQAAPLPEFEAQIEALGGKVLRFLTDHTFLVEMPAPVRLRVAQLPFVRWIGPYHPEYRLERPLREALLGKALRLNEQRYSIMVGERGAHRQAQVAATVKKLGGRVELVETGGALRVEATLTHEQLMALARTPDVQFIDRWGGPGELDMDIIRQVGGANAIEGLRGFTGQGVRAEVFDTEVLLSHREFVKRPLLHSAANTGSGGFHGSSCYSINFAQGLERATRGMIPDAQGIFFLYQEASQFGGTKSRYDMNRELTDPEGPYRAVFQTSSVGSSLVRTYTTISAEVDDYLIKSPLLSTQSQSNAGTQDSRPQSWAKNIVSVGAIYHMNSAARGDDKWNGSGSTGPAPEGRVKPDLAFFFDSIAAATGTGDGNYTNFGGTSAATPITGGHFGILFQMWHEGVWAGHGRKGDVFESRPNMATAKALMINGAYRYDWKGADGPNADVNRYRQGWGTADLKRLYDRAGVTSIIDETDLLTPMGKKTYDVTVASGESELAVTMVYNDPMGTVGAMQARINDLSLRVTSPTGIVYYGNNGLLESNLSTPGGRSNTIDTVENVFIKSPAAGTWKVEVLGDEIVRDAYLKTPAVDAAYGLVVSGGLIATATP